VVLPEWWSVVRVLSSLVQDLYHRTVLLLPYSIHYGIKDIRVLRKFFAESPSVISPFFIPD